MRLDHIAYRVADRNKTAKFFINALGYKIQTEFDLKFDDGTTTKCIALEPPEKTNGVPWIADPLFYHGLQTQYHLAPELFVSDGSPGSIVGEWVAARGGIGGPHHFAYQVKSVEETMKEWMEKGYAEFASDKPLRCPQDQLIQVFTKPSALTNIIYEFIERGEHGFCRENVKSLMESTKGN